jgi:hypothetical protein
LAVFVLFNDGRYRPFLWFNFDNFLRLFVILVILEFLHHSRDFGLNVSLDYALNMVDLIIFFYFSSNFYGILSPFMITVNLNVCLVMSIFNVSHFIYKMGFVSF